MAKKATKKVVAKPTKKPVKTAIATAKKGEVAKIALKKPESSKKAAPVKSSKAKEVSTSKPSKLIVSKSAKKTSPEPSEKGTSAKPQKTAEVPVNGASKKKNKAPELTEAVDKPEVVAEVEVKESLPSKKAKKFEGATEEESKWFELKDKHKNIKPQPYKMSEVYLEKSPIEHKILGWGFVLSVVNDRLEVLFRSGIKHLISNYKTNS